MGVSRNVVFIVSYSNLLKNDVQKFGENKNPPSPKKIIKKRNQKQNKKNTHTRKRKTKEERYACPIDLITLCMTLPPDMCCCIYVIFFISKLNILLNKSDKIAWKRSKREKERTGIKWEKSKKEIKEREEGNAILSDLFNNIF